LYFKSIWNSDIFAFDVVQENLFKGSLAWLKSHHPTLTTLPMNKVTLVIQLNGKTPEIKLDDFVGEL
jgi:hypothetical protein